MLSWDLAAVFDGEMVFKVELILKNVVWILCYIVKGPLEAYTLW